MLERLKGCEADLRAVGRITGEVQWAEADTETTAAVELAAPEA